MSSFACGISTFPWTGEPKDRFIIMQKGCSVNGATLAHEIGHFFGLLHTHETFRGVEFVDGSNCGTAGDLLCDTPADFNLAQGGLTGCTYNGNFADPSGNLYNPDPSNLMSYAPSVCRRKFSEMQNELMNFYYEQEYSTVLSDCDFFPDFSITSNESALNISSGQFLDLAFELGSEGVNEDTDLEVEFWLSDDNNILGFRIYHDLITVPGGSALLNTNFSFEFPIEYGTGEYFMTVLIDPDGKILERDERNNFHNISVTVDNSSLDDFILFPNPATDQVKIFLREPRASGKVSVLISDYYGRIVGTKNLFKNENQELFTSIDISDLPAGMYIVSIDIRFGMNRAISFYKPDL